MRPMGRIWILIPSLFLAACGGTPSSPDASMDQGVDTSVDLGVPVDLGIDMPRVLPPFCDPPGAPTPAALRKLGPTVTDLFVGGRTHAPEGTEHIAGLTDGHGSFPIQVVAHPTLPVAYVMSTGYTERAVLVVDVTTGVVVQQLDQGDAFFGLAISPDGATLYASGGASNVVHVYAIASADGHLTAGTPIAFDATVFSPGDYPAGLAVSPDGQHLWVATFHGSGGLSGKLVDWPIGGSTATPRAITPSVRPYDLLYVPAHHELYATGFADTRISVVDTTTFAETAVIDAGGGNPARLLATPDGATVYATVADADTVLAIDTATQAVRTTRTLGGEPGLVHADGTPLPGTSPTGLALDVAGGKLYVARSADNVVTVLDATTLAPMGSLLVGWYPTDVALVAGPALLVTNGKGLGAGPIPSYHEGDETGKQRMTGTIVRVDLSTLDLAAATTRAQASWDRTRDAYTYSCDGGTWPVPSVAGGFSPIEHVVLIERENKTYDTELGDLAGTDGDPSLVLFGEGVTPNIHALARQFTNSDNFYTDSETSVQGHFWLTSSFVNDYIERTWFEDYRGRPSWGMDPATAFATPDMGTFFTHLIHYGVPFRIYGEIVGTNGDYMGESVAAHLDGRFPGVFFNTGIKDEAKATYVAAQIARGHLDAFTYLLLPNDHTNGTGGSQLTPECMISDNDHGTGMIVDAISHSPFWATTAIFITQDDTQIGSDHVDYHRSILVVVSPWAKHGYTTSVMTSFPSLFRTWELILGVPPMNRLDAEATPLWDVFTSTPDMTPFTALPQSVPDMRNDGTPVSARWPVPPPEFATPDAVPELGRRIWDARRTTPFSGYEPDEGDAAESGAYREAWRHYLEYLDAHPEADPFRPY